MHNFINTQPILKVNILTETRKAPSQTQLNDFSECVLLKSYAQSCSKLVGRSAFSHIFLWFSPNRRGNLNVFRQEFRSKSVDRHRAIDLPHTPSCRWVTVSRISPFWRNFHRSNITHFGTFREWKNKTKNEFCRTTLNQITIFFLPLWAII